MSQALLRQLSLPAPEKIGPGKYQPWVETTKGETVWHPPDPAELGDRIELEVILNPATGLDGVPFLAWVERLLYEAGLLSKAHVLTAAGVRLDARDEIPRNRVRVRLWNASQLT